MTRLSINIMCHLQSGGSGKLSGLMEAKTTSAEMLSTGFPCGLRIGLAHGSAAESFDSKPSALPNYCFSLTVSIYVLYRLYYPLNFHAFMPFSKPFN